MSWNPMHTSLALSALCFFGPQAAATQDPEPEVGPTPIELPGMVDQAQEEILQLFRDIEQNLRKVDVLLSDAGAGDTQGLAEVEEAEPHGDAENDSEQGAPGGVDGADTPDDGSNVVTVDFGKKNPPLQPCVIRRY